MDYSDLDTELGNTHIDMSSNDSHAESNYKNASSQQKQNIEKEDNSSSSKVKESDSITNGILGDLFQSKKRDIAVSLISSAKEKSKTWYDKFICNFEFLGTYFELNSDDLKQRIKYGFIPLNKGFIGIKPDFYGPFWIYNTLIFLIAAMGSFQTYYDIIYNSDSTSNNKADLNVNYFVQYLPTAWLLVR